MTVAARIVPASGGRDPEIERAGTIAGLGSSSERPSHAGDRLDCTGR